MKMNEKGMKLIMQFEGIVDGDKSTPNYDPYVDPIGVYTIGYGHALFVGKELLTTKVHNHSRIAQTMFTYGMTHEEALKLINKDIAVFSKEVREYLQVTLTDNQFSALVCFAYNVGIHNFAESTLLKKVNKSDFVGAKKEFLRWNKAGGKVLAGLTRRREAEAALFSEE